MSENQETKLCPYCGEEIKAVAKKCKHCGKWLDGDNSNQDTSNSQPSFWNNKWFKIIAIIFLLGAIGYFIPEEDNTTTNNNYSEEAEQEISENQELYGDYIPDCAICPPEALEKLKTYCTQFQSNFGKRQCGAAIAGRYCKANNHLTQKFETLNDSDKNIFIDKYADGKLDYEIVFYACDNGYYSNDITRHFVFGSDYDFGAYRDLDDREQSLEFRYYNNCDDLRGLNKFNCYEQARKASFELIDLSKTLQKIKDREHYNTI